MIEKLNGKMAATRPRQLSINGLQQSIDSEIINGQMNLDVNINGWTRRPTLSGCVLDLPLYHTALSPTTFKSFDANKHSCTVIGATWRPQGRTFDGDDYINLDNVVSTVASDTAGTILARIMMPDATPAATSTLISFGDTDVLEFIRLDVRPNGDFDAVCYMGGDVKWWLRTDASAFADNTWALVGITHNATRPTLYLNGSALSATDLQDADLTVWFSQLTGLDNGRLGCQNNGTNGNTQFLSGTIGEVLICNRALSAAEISSIYQRTKWRYS